MIHTEADTSSKPAQLLALIHRHEHFLVTSHARPDGDAIGSALGLMHLLDGLGKRVDVAFADPIPSVYRGLPGAERICTPTPAAACTPVAAAGIAAGTAVGTAAGAATLPPIPPEVAILLECDSIERTGFAAITAPVTVNIDHHKSGREFADWNWIDPGSCAVGAMIYDFALAVGLPISPQAATCLYTAVLTDTGSFTYPCTTSATFALAGHLLDCGVDAYAVAEAVYFSNPEAKVRMLGAGLTGMVVEGPLAWSKLTLHEIRAAGASVSDCEGIVNYLIGIAGVQVAAVFRELPQGLGWRASLRSKGAVDVARVAEWFGGGGHHNASGCTLAGGAGPSIDDVLAALKGALPRP